MKRKMWGADVQAGWKSWEQSNKTLLVVRLKAQQSSAFKTPPAIVLEQQNSHCCEEPAPAVSSSSPSLCHGPFLGGPRCKGKSPAPAACAKRDEALVSVCWAAVYGVTGNCCIAECSQSTYQHSTAPEGSQPAAPACRGARK